MKYKISIIVPAYNCASTIGRLIDSVENQKIDNYELIIVDDGSIDDTGLIVKKRQKKNPNIVYIYKHNGGVSSARNEGIVESSGEYLMFIDSDDALSLEYIRNMEKFLGGYDLVVGIMRVVSDDGSVVILGTQDRSEKDAIKYLLNNWSVWNKLIRAELVKHKKFDESLVIAEDCKFICDLICGKQLKIGFSDQSFYNYYLKNDSAMHSNYSHEFLNGLYAEVLCFQKMQNSKIDTSDTQIVANGVYQFYTRYFNQSQSDYRNNVTDLKTCQYIVRQYFKIIFFYSGVGFKKKGLIFLCTYVPYIAYLIKTVRKGKEN